jgi:hypothetical protein
MQPSMIEGRSVLVTLMDDDLRPVADRREASFLQIVFEDDGEVLFYGTGRNKVPAWTLRNYPA